MSDFTTSDHVRISYTYTPGKQTIIYIHGWLQNKTIWQPFIKHFDKYGHLALDLRGHGESEEPRDEEYELSRHTQDVQELIQELDIKNPILIGHSMGAMISTQLMITIPIKHAVLLAGAAKTPGKISLTRAKKFLENIQEEEKTIKYIRQAHPKAAYACLRAIEHFNIENQLQENKTQTTLIVGEYDAMTPEEYSKQLNTLLPNSTLHTLAKAGHNTPITHTQEIIQILEKTL